MELNQIDIKNQNNVKTDSIDIHLKNQEITTKSNNKLKIAVAGEEPTSAFAHCTPTFGGMAVEIWKKTAKKYDLPYEFICDEGSFDSIVLKVSEGKYDVGLGDFSVIERRLKYVDYTRPYFIAKIYPFTENKLSTLFRIIFNFVVRGFLIFFSLLMITYTLIYKYYTKKSILESVYFVLLHIFSDDSEIISLKIRGANKYIVILLNSLWIFLRYTFFAIIITQLVDIIIKLQKTNISEDDFRLARDLLVTKGSSHVDFVKKLGKNPIELENLDEIYKKINESDNEEIYSLNDYLPILNDAKKRGVDVFFTKNQYLNDECSIIVNKNRKDILEKLNDVIIEMRLTDEMTKLCKKSFNTNSSACIF
jgi:ABC-type amino acid transport substrate-binding protein